MAHDHCHHGHRGHEEDARSTRALAWALGLTVFILIAEGVGGWLSNSLALLADAGHVLTDAGALGLSLFVAWLAKQPGSSAKTYGYLRWEIDVSDERCQVDPRAREVRADLSTAALFGPSGILGVPDQSRRLLIETWRGELAKHGAAGVVRSL